MVATTRESRWQPLSGLRQRVAWLGMVGLVGCATAPPQSPGDVTRAQIDRLAAGDEAGAAALLTDEARVRAPQWPAASELPTTPSVVEVERTAHWDGRGQSPAGSRELELVRTNDGWMIRRGVLALFRLDTAEGALDALGRAIEARDIGLVMALMPADSRRLFLPGAFEKAYTQREAAWRGLGRGIASGKVSWVSREAERAEVVIAVEQGERRVTLVREANGWKVFDVQPWNEYIAP